MQGTPKGLLQLPGSAHSLVERLANSLVTVGLANIVLVGNNDAYQRLAWPIVTDSPLGHGPMAGLLGLVEHAAKLDFEFVLAIACDMPRVDAPLLRRLRSECPSADALVPKREYWEPLCARYRACVVLPWLRSLLAAGHYHMTALLAALGTHCIELPIDPMQADALGDWDAPGDLPEDICYLGKPYPQGTR